MRRILINSAVEILRAILRRTNQPKADENLEALFDKIPTQPATEQSLIAIKTQETIDKFQGMGASPRVFYNSVSFPVYKMVRPFPDSVASPINSAQQKGILKSIGRIGRPRILDASQKDQSLGTGILITPWHVLTNRHVFENSWKRFISQAPEDQLGIEFLALKGDRRSDFYEFVSEELPIFLSGLDVAIFKLKRRAPHAPIKLKPIAIETIIGRELASIGYPDPHDYPDWYDDDTGEYIDQHVYGEDAEFAVKYITRGQAFRPSGAEANQHDFIFHHAQWGNIPIFCHNTSNLSGNSGSPIVDSETSELLGIHFRSTEDIYNDAANLAMPVSAIISALREMANGA